MEKPTVAQDDDALVPQQGNLATVPPHADSGLDETFEKMSQLLQAAMVCLQLQNDREADATARAAEALYNESKRKASPEDVLLLEILKNLVSLFVPLIRATVFQTEGRYARALEELAKGIAAANKGIATIEKYEGLPNEILTLVSSPSNIPLAYYSVRIKVERKELLR